jgi:hypothetical protein
MASRPLPWGGLIVSLGLGPPCDPFRQTGKRPGNPEHHIVAETGGDDCGFSPFCDDTSTTRDTAFEKIRARVLGTELATKWIGGSWIGGS